MIVLQPLLCNADQPVKVFRFEQLEIKGFVLPSSPRSWLLCWLIQAGSPCNSGMQQRGLYPRRDAQPCFSAGLLCNLLVWMKSSVGAAVCLPAAFPKLHINTAAHLLEASPSASVANQTIASNQSGAGLDWGQAVWLTLGGHPNTKPTAKTTQVRRLLFPCI